MRLEMSLPAQQLQYMVRVTVCRQWWQSRQVQYMVCVTVCRQWGQSRQVQAQMSLHETANTCVQSKCRTWCVCVCLQAMGAV